MVQASSSVSLQWRGSVRFGPFRFDRASGILSRGSEELFLPPRALNVLQVLVDRCGEVVSKDELVEVVWHDAAVTDQSPAEAIGVVREVLGDDSHHPTFIQTVHRRGYRFIAGVEPDVAEAAPARPEVLGPVDSGGVLAVASAEPVRPKLLRPTVLAVAVTVLLAAGVGLSVWISRGVDEPRAPMLHLPVALPYPVLPGTPTSVALSPDGTRLVYRAALDGGDGLFVLHLDRLDQRPLEGTEGGFGPFFSPDGQWVGYFNEEGRLRKIFLSGGPPVEVASATEGPVSGASWADDGTIVFAKGPRSKLWRVSAEGGRPTLLAAPDPSIGENGYLWPEVLPGSEWVLFTVEPVGIAGVEDFRLASLSLQTGEVRRLEVGGGMQPRRLGRRQLVFARRASLFAAPFDPDGPEVTGSAVPIVQNVMTLNRGAGQFAVSVAGVLAYVPGDALASTLQWVGGEDDGEVPVLHGTFGRHRLSPDHRFLALEIDGDIWIYDLQRDALTRFTTDEAGELLPLWASDGASLVFSSNREGPLHLFIKPVDGTGTEAVLLRSAYPKLADSWSSDGRWLVYTEIHPDTGRDLWLLPMPEAGEARPLLRTGFDESQASFSPDGSWVAFVSNEPGTFEVFVQPFPPPGPRYQVSARGGSSPQWSPSGDELFFAVGETLMAVTIESASPFRVGAPRRVLEIPNSNSFFAVGPEGRRFLVGKRQQSVRPDRLHLVTNGASLVPGSTQE